jgi:hypothetical protein
MAAKAPMCSDILAVEPNVVKFGQLFSFTVANEDNGYKYDINVNYIGRYGGVHYAAYFGRLYRIPDYVIAERNLSAEGADFPAMLKQAPNSDNCSSHVVAYLEGISSAAKKEYRQMSQETRLLRADNMRSSRLPGSGMDTSNPFGMMTAMMFPWLAAPTSTPRQQAQDQAQLIMNALHEAGLNPQPMNSPQELVNALRAGKKAFFGVLGTMQAISLQELGVLDEQSIKYIGPGQGAGGHAYAGLGIVDGINGKSYVIIADPSSGMILPLDIARIAPFFGGGASVDP